MRGDGLDIPDLEHVEWELLRRPIEVTEFEELGPLPEGTWSLRVERGDAYAITATFQARPTEPRQLFARRQQLAGTLMETEVIQGRVLPDLRVEVAGALLGDYRLDLLGQENVATGEVRLHSVTVTSPNSERPGWVVDWFINGRLQIGCFSGATERLELVRVARRRKAVDNHLVSHSSFKAKHISNSRDFAAVSVSGLSIVAAKCPKGTGPDWSHPFGLEFRAVEGALPSEEVRTSVSEVVSFLAGRHLLKVGSSSFSESGQATQEAAMNPWGNDVVSVCANGSLPPTPISEVRQGLVTSKFEDDLNQLIAPYIAGREELAFGDALWKLWLARRMPAGTDLPVYASALETLMGAWFKSKRSKSQGNLMAKDEFDKLIGPELEIIRGKLGQHPHSQRILSKLSRQYSMGVNERFEVFFEELGLQVGKAEKDAIRGRNAMAHGGRSRDGSLPHLVGLGQAYLTLLHRVLLRLLGYQGRYVDYATPGFPARSLDEPAGSSRAE